MGGVMNTSAPIPTAAVEKMAFSTTELCVALGVSRVTIYRLEKRGILRPVPGIRHKVWPRREVERFLNGSNVAAS
jgi:predicted DNA-binding transcriptional regulator AlpA